MVPQNSTSILKFLSNSDIDEYSFKTALRITPIGKLFHIISNISYLSLLRFKIVFVYSKYVVSLHQTGTIRLLFVWPLNFPKVVNVSAASFAQLPVLLALCWSFFCCWWWGGRWTIQFGNDEFCCCGCTFDSKLVSSHKFYRLPYRTYKAVVLYGTVFPEPGVTKYKFRNGFKRAV